MIGDLNIRSVAKNFASLSLLQLINMAIPLLMLPYIASTIGVELLGLLAIGTSIAILIQNIVDYGFSLSATREISLNQDAPEKQSIILSTVLSAKAILLAASLTITFSFTLLIPTLKNNLIVIAISLLYIPGHILFADFVFQGLERMATPAIFNTIIKTSAAALTLLLVQEPDDYLLIPTINGIAYTACGILCIWKLNDWGIELSISKKSLTQGISEIKNNVNIFLAILTPNLYNNAAVLIISFFAPLSSIGHYSLARTIISVPEQIVSMYSRAAYPLLSRNIDYHRRYLIAGIALTLIIAITIFGLSTYIIDVFFGEEYADTAHLTTCLAFAPLTLFLVNAYGSGYLYIKSMATDMRNIVFFSSALGALMLAGLSPTYGVIAGIASLYGARITMFSLFLIKSTHIKTKPKH